MRKPSKWAASNLVIWSFIIGTVLMPFTSLRLFFIGPGELFVLLGCFLYLLSKNSIQFSNCHFSIFYATFMCIACAGWLVSINTQSQLPPIESTFFDMQAYVFVLVVLLFFENSVSDPRVSIEKTLQRLFYLTSGLSVGLFAVSLLQSNLFGYELVQHQRFVPLANNLHQYASFIVFFPFLGIFVAYRASNVFLRMFVLSISLVLVVVVIETDSFKAILGLCFGAIAMCVSWSLGLSRRLAMYGVWTVLLCGMIAVFYAYDFMAVLENMFREEDKNGVRSHIWSTVSLDNWWKLIIGNGPGPHVRYFYRHFDAHQTPLTLLLQAGILPVVMFLSLLSLILYRLIYVPPLLAMFVCIVPYIMGGDILRRLPVIMILALLLHYGRELMQVRSPSAETAFASR